MTTVPPAPIEYQLIGLAEDGGIGNLLAGLDQKQGRVTLKQSQLEFASIDRELEAIRVGSYFRIVAR